MKLGEMFKRQSVPDEEFSQLESGLGNAMMMDLAPLLTSDEVAETSELEPDSEPDPAEPAYDGDFSEPRTTGPTQGRLAEFSAFEDMHRATQLDLEAVGAALARVNASHHQTREFLNSVYSGIHRSNELELAVARLSAENRSLFRQAEHVKRLKNQLESLSEAFKHRESKLVDSASALRESLSSAKLDLAETQVGLGRLEAERQELMNSLANATNHSERAARENEMLRERTINLAADLDSVSRKRTEAERRLDEYVSLHERDAADLADLRSKLVNSESERQRLQKQNDALQAKLVDVSESLATLELECADQAQRHDLTVQGLRNERDTFATRADAAIRAEQEASDRATDLMYRLNEANDSRKLAEDRLASVAVDPEANGQASA